MKIAITADFHLKTEYPERKLTLQNIFQKLQSLEISHLIIAGDLFDREERNYFEFDKLVQQFPEIKVYVIPGNHDANINSNYFTANNLKIIDPKNKDKKITFENLQFFFIPYETGKSMDEALAENNIDNSENLVLISHGDYISYSYEVNPYEKSFYMPLSRFAVEKYKFLKIFLGHIHKPLSYGRVYYPGSPCPLDITETGKRSIIIFDTYSQEIKREYIDTPYIYYDESILTYPVENEFEIIENTLKNLINSWRLRDDEKKKVELRLKVKGCSQNINALKQKIEEIIKKEEMKLNEIDVTEVLIISEEERERDKLSIFEKVKERFKKLLEINDKLKEKEKDIEVEILKYIFTKSK